MSGEISSEGILERTRAITRETIKTIIPMARENFSLAKNLAQSILENIQGDKDKDSERYLKSVIQEIENNFDKDENLKGTRFDLKFSEELEEDGGKVI
jgi:hypothetical protein